MCVESLAAFQVEGLYISVVLFVCTFNRYHAVFYFNNCMCSRKRKKTNSCSFCFGKIARTIRKCVFCCVNAFITSAEQVLPANSRNKEIRRALCCFPLYSASMKMLPFGFTNLYPGPVQRYLLSLKKIACQHFIVAPFSRY